MTELENVPTELKLSLQMVDGLSSYEAYDHTVSSIRIKQTHSAWIVLTGKFAYKIKKPVNFGFLNFSTLALRKKFCEKEVLLNQRLASDIYIEVVTINGSHHRPIINGKGKVLDYAVKMRQFSDHCLLSDLADSDRLNERVIEQLVVMISQFHMTSEAATNDSKYGTSQCIFHWMAENYHHIDHELVQASERKKLSKITTWTEKQQRALSEAFQLRKAEHKIRNCHGDLHLANIALVESRVIAFDCIEFNDELRWIDVVSEVAFLVMDLMEKKLEELAFQFLNGYLQITGDYSGLKVFNYYLVYRAIVRAKVAMLRFSQMPESDNYRDLAYQEFRQYLSFCHRYTQQKPCGLFITVGFSGSGKSTLASALSQKLGLIQIRSDVERKRLAGFAADKSSRSALDDGLYTKENNQRTYLVLNRIAAQIIGTGYSVILDATFLTSLQRSQAQKVALAHRVPLTILHVVAATETLRERIILRQRQALDPSEATLAVLEKQLLNYEPLTKTERAQTIVVDADSEVDVQRIAQHKLFGFLQR